MIMIQIHSGNEVVGLRVKGCLLLVNAGGVLIH